MGKRNLHPSGRLALPLRHARIECLLCDLMTLRPRFLLAMSLILAQPACISRRIDVPPFIPPAREATISELIEIVNRRQSVQTLTVKADLQFETAEAAEAGVMRRYRSANGRILLERPEQIRLQIEAPVLSVSIAEMASDGEHFQLLVYPEEHRALISGSNRRSYVEEARKLDQDPELKKAGPLVNIRPQHFTDAFLFPPIDTENPDVITVMDEARPLEDDDRRGAREDQKVVRSYYILTVIWRGEQAPRRKYWFDRTRDLALSRQQVYDSKGLLVGEINFSKYLPPEPTTGERFASEIQIHRPYDEYSLRITLQPDSLVVNRDIPPQAFSLEPPPEWGDSIRRIDLDRKDKN